MRRLLLLILVSLTAVHAGPAAQDASRPDPNASRAYADAYDAWDRGDYAVALERLKALAAAADEKTFEDIALLTGELYQTREVTPDGRNPSFTATGHILYETGAATAAVTRVAGPDFKVSDEFPGRNAAADYALKNIAYVLPDGGLALRLHGAQASERRITPAGFAVTSLAWSPDGSRVFYTGAAGGNGAQHDVYAYTLGGAAAAAPARLTNTPARETGVRVVPGGAALLFTVPGSGGRGGGTPVPAVYGYLDLQSNEAGAIDGASAPPVFSADGKTLAYLSREGDTTKLMIRSGRTAPVTVLTTTDRLD